jgi:hypothetical protein
MEVNGVLDGSGDMVPGRMVLEGTDLDIAHDMRGDDLVMRVNKAGVLVFRALLVDAAKVMDERQLLNFNSFAPDMVFRIGDSQEGLMRTLSSAGIAEAVAEPRRGFIRWLLGR